jgi:hypothetical protein
MDFNECLAQKSTRMYNLLYIFIIIHNLLYYTYRHIRTIMANLKKFDFTFKHQ